MKFAMVTTTCGVLLLALGLVGATDVDVRGRFSTLPLRDNALDQTLIEFLENFKQSMVCGIPDLGIPVLAPYEHEHLEVSVNQKGLKLTAELNDMLVDGLNEFEIKNLHVNLLKLQLTFEFYFGSIRTKGDYRAKGKLIGLFSFDRKGPFHFNANGVTLKGSVKVGLSGDKVQLRGLEITPSLKSVNSDVKNLFPQALNTFLFNRMVEAVLPSVINDNQEAITGAIEDGLMPLLNDLLGEFTLQDLIDAASGEGVSTPVTC